MLGEAQQDVSRRGADNLCPEASAPAEEDQVTLFLGALGHGRGRDAHPAETDHRSQVMHRHPKPGLVSHLNRQGLIVQMHVGALGGHVQGIEQFAGHAVIPPLEPE